MNHPLWTAAELVDATGGVMSAPWSASGVSIDTRTLAEGDVFIALRGDGQAVTPRGAHQPKDGNANLSPCTVPAVAARDGHAFAADAVAKGAAGVLVHQGVAPSVPVLRVDDTLAGLTRLGGYARSRLAQTPGWLVAVTGSVGKTTTKEMLRLALAPFGPTHAAAASHNNHWGLPLTLARMPRDTRFCVTEIGMNHSGEIAPLARLARPHVAVITTVAPAHVGHLGTIEAIADEKASIMNGVEPSGTAVLPADSAYLPRLLEAVRDDVRVLTFGTTATADVRLVHAEYDANGSLIHIDVRGRTASLRLNAPGRHMAVNALATIAAVAALGLDHVKAIEALEAFAPLTGRGARRDVALASGSVLLLDESYNANGASVRAALDVLRLQPGQRRIAVLGDMLELGAEARAEHRSLADAVRSSVDRLFTCGPLMRDLFDAMPASLRGFHAGDAGLLAPVVAEAMRRGDVILVKGSLGSGMRRVVEAIDAAAAQPATVTTGHG